MYANVPLCSGSQQAVIRVLFVEVKGSMRTRKAGQKVGSLLRLAVLSWQHEFFQRVSLDFEHSISDTGMEYGCGSLVNRWHMNHVSGTTLLSIEDISLGGLLISLGVC